MQTKLISKIKELDLKDIRVYLLVFCALVLISPHIMQFIFNSNLLLGNEAYYNTRIANLINSEGVPFQDTFNEGSGYIFEPYHFILAAIGKVIGVLIASKLLALFRRRS